MTIKTTDLGCWLWQGACASSGYPLLTIDGERRSVHRHVFLIFNGPLKTDPQYCVVQTCNNKACINPAHLVQITRAQAKRRNWHIQMDAVLGYECEGGHPWSAGKWEMKRSTDGTALGRRCLICKAEQHKEYMRRRRIKARNQKKIDELPDLTP